MKKLIILLILIPIFFSCNDTKKNISDIIFLINEGRYNEAEKKLNSINANNKDEKYNSWLIITNGFLLFALAMLVEG